jgi:adenine specific DNA methylase Mod
MQASQCVTISHSVVNLFLRGFDGKGARMTNHLYYGDNLGVLRESIRDESVDLIYLDPPFNSNATYNMLFREPSGEPSQAQIEVFEDTWHWNEAAERAFDDVMQSGNAQAADMLRALRSFLRDNDMMAYITHMSVRMLELRRVLKPTGSIYLHCDPTGSHYLKVMMDAVFGKENFLSEVIWKRTSAHNAAKRWGPVHDVLLLYRRGPTYVWNRVLQPLDSDYIATFYKFEDKKGKFAIDNLTGAGTRAGESGRPWRGVDPTSRGRHWAVPTAASLPPWVKCPADYADIPVQKRLDFLDAQDLIQWPDKEGGMPRFKRYLTEKSGGPVQDVITDIAPVSASDAERLGYPTQKPVSLLERIISASSNEGDIVLDPFCGCGTTIHAAQKLASSRSCVGRFGLSGHRDRA